MDEINKASFEAKGYMQVDTFEDNGKRFTLYHMNPNNPFVYITGDMFLWEVGLRWDLDLKSIVKDYAVVDEVKRKIESCLRGSRR